MKNVGKPCEGEPHARIDGGRLETEASATVTGVAPPGGKPREERPRDLPPPTPPRQPPTLHRTVVSKEIFSALDHYVWKLTYRWARRAHPNKGKRWVTARYFGAFHPARKDRWVFGDQDTGRYLVKFSWTPIVRHTLVKGGSSPDDAALTSYWAARRRRGKPPLGPFLRRLLRSQQGRCPACGDLLLHADQEPQSPDEWEQWLTTLRKAIRHSAVTSPDGPTDDNARCLMHTHCARRHNASTRTPALLPPRTP